MFRFNQQTPDLRRLSIGVQSGRCEHRTTRLDDYKEMF
jgi:hypothetical protein